MSMERSLLELHHLTYNTLSWVVHRPFSGHQRLVDSSDDDDLHGHLEYTPPLRRFWRLIISYHCGGFPRLFRGWLVKTRGLWLCPTSWLCGLWCWFQKAQSAWPMHSSSSLPVEDAQCQTRDDWLPAVWSPVAGSLWYQFTVQTKSYKHMLKSHFYLVYSGSGHPVC